MNHPDATAEIGVFGGSGFYSLLTESREFAVNTPYGPPSDRITIGDVAGRRVAFLPRHGRMHQLPPHRIEYRANLWAMKELGVRRILAPGACGSLQADIEPGCFVICDQFVDRTSGRRHTFYDGPAAVHLSMDEPYCPQLRKIATQTAASLKIPVRGAGTAVIVQGPRFSTKAESRWFTQMGWSVVNMTQYPEVVLARELEICYLNISLVTDWDVGLVGEPGVKPVTANEVHRVFAENNQKLRDLIYELIPAIPLVRGCGCGEALAGAVISPVETPR
ncbi:MAG: S-methyl-5'-thioadenosine phosphorylase [Candidatus Geothermincolia bacterium]